MPLTLNAFFSVSLYRSASVSHMVSQQSIMLSAQHDITCIIDIASMHGSCDFSLHLHVTHSVLSSQGVLGVLAQL